MVKTLFISQPMRGLTDEEIMAAREKAVKEAETITGEELEVVNSFFKSGLLMGNAVKNKPLYYLGASLKLLATADYVYFVEGWKYARGCIIEEVCAREYGVKILNPGENK